MALPSPQLADRLQVRIAITSGSVVVTATEGAQVEVERGGRAVAVAAGVVEVQPDKASSSLRVRCPPACDLVIGTTSGRVELRGPLGAVSVTSASGSIRAADVAEADLRTHSGKVEVGGCRAGCRVATKSGSIVVESTGTADVSTVSGTIRIDRVEREAQARAVSGGVTIASQAGGPVRARSVSGNITVRLPAGVRPAIRSSSSRAIGGGCEEGDDVVVEVGTVSGSVVITAR